VEGPARPRSRLTGSMSEGQRVHFVPLVSNLADMYDQYGVELTAAAVQFPVRHPVVAAVMVGTQRRTSCLDVAASVGRRPSRGLA
jgi:aryl-alcohol dehydrogenase-like predicted oxidoreductase